MKVCLVTPEFPLDSSSGRGGIGTYSETLAKALIARGVEVHVVIYGALQPSQPLRSKVAVHLHFVELPWVRYFSSYFPGFWQSVRLAQALSLLDRQHHFDVFEMYNDEGVTLFPVLMFSGRTVFRMHSSIRQHIVHKGEAFTWRRKFSVWLDRRAARSARNLVTHSKFHTTEMAADYGLEHSKFVVIPHCTWPISSIKPLPSTSTVAYIGSLDRRKGIDVFLQAIPLILTACPSANFVVIGRDTGFSKEKPWKQWFEDTYGPNPRVDFTGSVSDEELDGHWERIGIIVVPSRYESFGLAVIEGFSRAKTVITTRAAALPEVAGDGALLVEPGNSIEISEAVTSLLEDPEKAARTAARGYEVYLESYTPEIFADRIMRLYSAIAAGISI
jgi:hypothetical protein